MNNKAENPPRPIAVETQRRHWMSVLDFGLPDGVPTAPARDRPGTSDFIAMP